ncbi:MAG: hypothetical protein J6N32_01575 [Clostridia bacterium]|nr:hypothetical protein [Clostridia bacterium]MBO5126037.1 hypothetical protein [Clostridia bacterium]MBP3292417.1 hypothetical protein [Clostridia bacterium]
MKLIEELYTCDLSALDRSASFREECRDLDRLKNRCTGKLLAGLDDSQKHLLRTIERCSREKTNLAERCAFSLGFRLGVRLMTESFANDE